MKLDRRTFLTASLGLAAGASTTALLNRPRYHVSRKVPRSRVAILMAESYSHNLENVLYSGLELFHLDLRGKTVLLKPNLVDYIPGNHINTHPLLVAAAVECFRRLGAKNVLVGEGPGHQRDTELVLLESGFTEELRQLKVPFVDLNRDESAMVAPGRAKGRLHRFHAKSEDAPLVGSHSQHEKHVRCCAGREVRLAKEHPSSERDSGKYPRCLRHRAGSIRDCRCDCGNGRKRTTQWT